MNQALLCLPQWVLNLKEIVDDLIRSVFGFCKVGNFMIWAIYRYVSRLAHQLGWIRFYRGCFTIRFLASPRFFFLWKGKLLRPPFLKSWSPFL